MIGIIGCLAEGREKLGGQEVKTDALYQSLVEKYGAENVDCLDTQNWKKHPFKFFIEFHKFSIKSNVIIMLPAQNGVKVFGELLLHYQKKGKRIYYDVIGGWLADKLKKKNRLKERLQKFDGIWVETLKMQSDLKEMNFNNVTVIPNFKDIRILDKSELIYQNEAPFKICTFSRVIKEKGIEDAVKAVKQINEENGKAVYKLDIYGKVEESYKEEFDSLIKEFPDYVSYKGAVEPNKSVEILKSYYALLFPTHFLTEGIPGSIIDAYCAGVPVISSLWINYEGVFEPEITGYGFTLFNYDEFLNQLKRAANSVKEFNALKLNCIEKAKCFLKETAVEEIAKQIKG